MRCNLEKPKIIFFEKRWKMKVAERWRMNRTNVEVVDKFNYLGMMSYNLVDRCEFSGFGFEGSCLPICTMSSQKELILTILPFSAL